VIDTSLLAPPPRIACRAAFLAALLAAVAAAETAPGGDDWKYDVVYRKKGEPFRGLVEEQTGTVVRLRCVSRRPGSPTVVYRIELDAREVRRVELAPEEERERLRQRLDALRQERHALTEQLKLLNPGARGSAHSGDSLDLRSVPWVVAGGGEALEYRSSHFRLVSNARRDEVHLAAVHLEQVYAAYTRFLPPRAAGAPTLIVLTGSRADYQKLLEGRGLNLTNPAFYDAERNQIVCTSDLQRLAGELQKARQHHRKLYEELKESVKDLEEAYRGNIPPELKARLAEVPKRIEATEARNQAVFKRAQKRLFQRLYHEAFHAYLSNFVYPPAESTVPHWLNEGLAQIFETAIVEVGELRVGHADLERLEAVRGALKEGALLPLADLLRAGSKQFQVAHGANQQASDRYYLASWALAFYLTFDQKALGSRGLDDYVRALHRRADPLDAFRDLAGRPLPEFEKDFVHYLEHLRADGTSGAR
jgi:regulator of replication initiation timing